MAAMPLDTAQARGYIFGYLTPEEVLADFPESNYHIEMHENPGWKIIVQVRQKSGMGPPEKIIILPSVAALKKFTVSVEEPEVVEQDTVVVDTVEIPEPKPKVKTGGSKTKKTKKTKTKTGGNTSGIAVFLAIEIFYVEFPGRIVLSVDRRWRIEIFAPSDHAFQIFCRNDNE